MIVLVIDVGGTHVKVNGGRRRTPIKIPSGHQMTAKEMVRQVRSAISGWTYDGVSIGYPGIVLHGQHRHVFAVVSLLRGAFEVDDVVVGGGNVKLLRRLPRGVRRGRNADAFVGGVRLWQGAEHRTRPSGRPNR